MSRGTCPRVNFCGYLWIFSATLFAVNVVDVLAHSCREVRTAFQLRQIGPLSRVPETPGTDVDLLVCMHQGPTCCTRKMEESYQSAVRRDTPQNIRSYSFDLKHLLAGHASAFQDAFQYLLSFSQGHLSSLLVATYPRLADDALPHVNRLFSTLSDHLRGANVSVEAAVHRLFDGLFPLVYTQLVNPGVAAPDAGSPSSPSSATVTTTTTEEEELGGGGGIGGIGGGVGDGERADCLRMTRQDINPFGPHPAAMAKELAAALGAGRRLGLALAAGLEPVNATDHLALSKECVRALVRMEYCSHCGGLTLIKPCLGYCLNVLRGCLAGPAELDAPWRRHSALLEQLTHAVAGHHSLELALLGVRDHVNEALLYAQLHGPLITTTVDKVCGLPTGEPSTTQPNNRSEVTTSRVTSPPLSPTPPSSQEALGKLAHLRSSFYSKNSLRATSREFLMYLQRYKSFFSVLPEMMCEGDNVVNDSTCWSGGDVVESYTRNVVGNGLHAQRRNPEVKVRSLDPYLEEVKKRLEQFNQETQESFPDMDQNASWDELGSGEVEVGSGTDCDDEDGCQASGDGKDVTSHQEVSSAGRPTARQPAGAGVPPQERPQKPPVVRVRGGASTPSSWGGPWSPALLLLLATLGLQWNFF